MPDPLKGRSDPRGDEVEDVYAAQREELMELLRSCMAKHHPLTALGNPVLGKDDIPALLQKIKHKHPFSRRERTALVEAGFQPDKLFPLL